MLCGFISLGCERESVVRVPESFGAAMTEQEVRSQFRPTQLFHIVEAGEVYTALVYDRGELGLDVAFYRRSGTAWNKVGPTQALAGFTSPRVVAGKGGLVATNTGLGVDFLFRPTPTDVIMESATDKVRLGEPTVLKKGQPGAASK